MLRKLFIDNLTIKIIAAALAVILYVYVQSERDVTTTVTPRLVLQLPDGMVNTSPVPDRVKVVVSGAWSAVSTVSRKDVPPVRVDLSGFAAGPVTYYLDEESIRVPPGLRITSIIPAALSLELEPTVTRKVPVVAAVRGDPPEGFHAGVPTVDPTEVSLTGARADMKALTEVTTEPVDIAGATSEVHAKVRLVIQRAHVSREDHEPVSVTVPIIEESLERRISGVQVTTPDGVTVHPATVSVTVAGPHRQVAKLGPADVTVTLPADAMPAPGQKARVEVDLALPKGVRVAGRVPTVEVKRAVAAPAPAGGKKAAPVPAPKKAVPPHAKEKAPAKAPVKGKAKAHSPKTHLRSKRHKAHAG